MFILHISGVVLVVPVKKVSFNLTTLVMVSQWNVSKLKTHIVFIYLCHTGDKRVV